MTWTGKAGRASYWYGRCVGGRTAVPKRFQMLDFRGSTEEKLPLQIFYFG